MQLMNADGSSLLTMNTKHHRRRNETIYTRRPLTVRENLSMVLLLPLEEEEEGEKLLMAVVSSNRCCLRVKGMIEGWPLCSVKAVTIRSRGVSIRCLFLSVRELQEDTKDGVPFIFRDS